MKVLVTGAAGLIGSHVTARFLDLGHRVVAVDNLTGGYVDNIDPRAKFSYCDCADLASVTRVLEAAGGVDLVYHCAAFAHEGLSVFSPDVVTRNVFGATVATLTGSIATGAKSFVFCSSMARYGHGSPPFKETDEPKPVDPYGIAKLAAEKEVQLLCDVHGVRWATAVPHNVIGVGQKYDDPFRNVVGIMINRVLQGKPPVIYGDGSQRRCFSFISDVVDCLVKMGLGSDASGRTVNIGPDDKDSGNLVSVLELSRLVQQCAETDFEPVFVQDRPQEVREAFCSSDLARQLLSYETRVSLREGIQLMVDWVRKRGPRDFDYYLPIEIPSPKTPVTWTSRLI